MSGAAENKPEDLDFLLQENEKRPEAQEEEEEESEDESVELMLQDDIAQDDDEANGDGGPDVAAIHLEAKTGDFVDDGRKRVDRIMSILEPTVVDGVARDYPAIYDVDMESLESRAWTMPGADMTDWFNYGFDETSWKQYCARQIGIRIAQTKMRQDSGRGRGRDHHRRSDRSPSTTSDRRRSSRDERSNEERSHSKRGRNDDRGRDRHSRRSSERRHRSRDRSIDRSRDRKRQRK